MTGTPYIDGIPQHNDPTPAYCIVAILARVAFRQAIAPPTLANTLTATVAANWWLFSFRKNSGDKATWYPFEEDPISEMNQHRAQSPDSHVEITHHWVDYWGEPKQTTHVIVFSTMQQRNKLGGTIRDIKGVMTNQQGVEDLFK